MNVNRMAQTFEETETGGRNGNIPRALYASFTQLHSVVKTARIRCINTTFSESAAHALTRSASCPTFIKPAYQSVASHDTDFLH